MLLNTLLISASIPLLPLGKQFAGTLQTHALVAIVNVPSIKTEIALLQLPFPLNPLLHPLIPVRLGPLEPTRQEVTHVRFAVLTGLLYIPHVAVTAPSQQEPVLVRERLHQRQYFLNVLPDEFLVLDRVVQAKPLTFELWL
jgi:hypothetical protein